MKTRWVSVAFSGGIALALALGGFAARADAATEEGSTTQATPATGQARIAETTLKLEKAFDDQFVKGQIDRDALAPLVDDVLQAMPESARPKVQAHIEKVIDGGQQLASQMGAEERAHLAAPTSQGKLDPVQIGWIGNWGWPSYSAFSSPYYSRSFYASTYSPYYSAYYSPYVLSSYTNPFYLGWNGLGAFNFPGMYYGTYGCGFGNASCNLGYGLGTSGWFW